MAGSSSPIACARRFVRLSSQIDALDEAITERSAREIITNVLIEEPIKTAKRLMTIPGVGPVAFDDLGHHPGRRPSLNGREFAAFLGLTPRQNSSGGKASRAHHQDGRPLPAQASGHEAARRCAIARRAPCVYGRLGMSSAKTVKYKFKLTAVALASQVAHIVFVLMTRAANTTTGQSPPERQAYSSRFSPPRRSASRGRRGNDVNQRQRLGSPNSGQRQYDATE